MPELPEVEVYREFVEDTSLGKKIDHIEVPEKRILEKTSEKELNDLLSGKVIKSASRIGKYLFLQLDKGKGLEVHFGMTGYFELSGNGQLPASTRAVICFSNGEKLAYVDRRKIGHLAVSESFDALKKDHKLGPDALEISGEEFVKKLSGTSAKVKSALMDQQIVSGIGNVYADEILFQARIHPESKSSALTGKHLEKIYENVGPVMNTAIEYIRVAEGYQKGRKSFPAGYLLPVRKEGSDCPSGCGRKVEMIKVGGRSTYFCPSCQELIK